MTPYVVLALALESGNAASDATAPGPNVVVPTVYALSLMSVMRVTETLLWPDPFARPKYFGDHYEEAFSKPPLFETNRAFMEWDGDHWPVNVLGHGLFGSELYLRSRRCNMPWYGALAFTTAASAVWEYGFEANGVRPSGLDLVYTPLAGMVLGEARFAVVRASRTMHSATWATVTRAVVDPFGELGHALDVGCREAP